MSDSPPRVYYQVYLPAFADGDGDGWGDLPGLIERLDYLSGRSAALADSADSLGVNGLILSPFFPSRGRDSFYSVTDYRQIDPRFGTLDDFSRLCREAARRGLSLLIDLVLNHTSSEHPWFQDARQGRRSHKREWYYWRDPSPDGGPPNNWLSCFGGPAWTLDAASGQYYLHTFYPDQPDLNWRHPEVSTELKRILHFWTERGAAGFRLDAFPHLFKDERWRDDPVNPNFMASQEPHLRHRLIYSSGHSRLAAGLREFREKLAPELDNRPLVLETYLEKSDLERFYAQNSNDQQAPMEIGLRDADERFRPPVGRYPYYELGNHDQPRIVSRMGEGRAKLLTLLQLLLPGRPLIYQGEELGLPTATVPVARQRDAVPYRIPGGGRDGVRTPMPWDERTIENFAKPDSWLPVPSVQGALTVERQTSDPNSWLNFYRRLLVARRRYALGGCFPAVKQADAVTIYHFRARRPIWLIINWAPWPASVAAGRRSAKLLVSTANRPVERLNLSSLKLNGHEGLVLAG